MQPDGNAHLFEKTYQREIYRNMAGESVDCRREEQQIPVLQAGEHLIGMPADAADQRKKIIGNDPCSDNTPLRES